MMHIDDKNKARLIYNYDGGASIVEIGETCLSESEDIYIEEFATTGDAYNYIIEKGLILRTEITNNNND